VEGLLHRKSTSRLQRAHALQRGLIEEPIAFDDSKQGHEVQSKPARPAKFSYATKSLVVNLGTSHLAQEQLAVPRDPSYNAWR
jgi:hypothetical protein